MTARKPRQKKEIVLVRHAKSSWDDPLLDDFDRNLSKRGRKAAKQVGGWLRDEGLHPDMVLCSAAVRTRETLALILEELRQQPAIAFERRLYLADADDLLARLRELPDDVASVLLIGHNPGLQDLALSLAPARARRERKGIAEKFPTAAVAWFRDGSEQWTEMGSGDTELVAFRRPADLKD